MDDSKIISEKTNLSKYFLEDNLVKQEIFKSNKKFIPIYINEELYEEIFKREYDLESALRKVSDIFSITLNKNSSSGEAIGFGYADRQMDPMGISLSGNEGSGRAYFFGDCFNIKGDKTSLATSSKEVYSNGKFSLAAAIKETVISNILSKELTIPTFETLAILDTTDNFEFISEYLADDDSVKEERYILPSVIEIRVNKDKKLYRISNAFVNEDKFTFKELKELSNKLALLEAEKFIKRFLHGSWSVGNISVDANLIDFDTASFVKGRSPQYSNTNKYKSNYFGYEILGSKIILKLLYENALVDQEHKEELENYIDEKYNEYLKIEFIKIIGLDYDKYYLKYRSIIDELFDKFINLSRKFIPNYYDLNVLGKDSNNTFIYDFSKFFQNYLINKDSYSNKVLYGVDLLLNDTKNVCYKSVGFIKEKVEEYFSEHIVLDDDANILSDAISFINLYNKLFEQIKESDINDIKFKQYILNMNRNYLYGDEGIYSILSYLYSEKKLDNLALNKIIKNLIMLNIRKYNDLEKEYYCNLELCNNYLSYMVISKEYYYFVLVPYNDFDIRKVELNINDKDITFSNIKDMYVSEKVFYENMNEITDFNSKIYVNGDNYNRRLMLSKYCKE